MEGLFVYNPCIGGDEMNVPLAIGLGVLVGIISGLVGIGGGLVAVPLLVYGMHMTQHRAQGTSLAMLLLPSGLLAFWKYYKAGNADLSLGLWLSLGLFAGGYLGGTWAQWAQSLPESSLRRGFAVLLVLAGVKMFFQK
jgi:uncharacterized membrane protein YfcA